MAQFDQLKIVITGANGFVGSWLARYLDSTGHSVKCFVRESSDSSRLSGSLLTVHRTDEYGLLSAIAAEKPDVVILADWEGVGSNARDSASQLLNVSRWKNIAQACVSTGVKKVIAFGSQAELGYSQSGADEKFPESPQSAYAKSKSIAHSSMREIFNQTDIDFSWVRLFAVYGPKDNSNWLIPSLIRNIRDGKSMKLTKCTHKWNYLHVYDLCALIGKLLESPDSVPILNAAHPISVPLKDYITVIADILDGWTFLSFGDIEYQSNMVKELTPNVSLAISMGWSPIIEWESGIKHLIGESSSVHPKGDLSNLDFMTKFL